MYFRLRKISCADKGPPLPHIHVLRGMWTSCPEARSREIGDGCGLKSAAFASLFLVAMVFRRDTIVCPARLLKEVMRTMRGSRSDARRLPILLLLAALPGFSPGCSSGGGDDVADVDTKIDEALPDNLAILTKVYAPQVSKPAGFYTDPRPDPGISATIHHVRNSDVGLVAAAPFELCTDDLVEALQWSDLDAAGRASSGALLTSGQTDMYYEFVRPLSDLPDWFSYGRVFKCTFVDRRGVDARATSGPAGRLNKPAFTSADLKQVSEYFWTFSAFNNPGNAVLATGSFDTGSSMGHALTLATLRADGGTLPDCDAVDVFDWELVARPDDGQMEWVIRDLFTFDGRSRDGVPEVCDGP